MTHNLWNIGEDTTLRRLILISVKYQKMQQTQQYYIENVNIPKCVLIKYIICESLVMIQHFRQEYQNFFKNWMKSSSVIVLSCQYNKICLEIRQTICKSLGLM